MILVEFETPEALLAAARAASEAGLRDLDAYSPHPVDGLDEAIGMRHDFIAPLALAGGVSGAALGFGMQAYACVRDYPIDVAGRPLFSWPSFVPVTFEMMVLGAALAAAFGLFALNRLPRLWQPVFESERFLRASKDRFFLCVRDRVALDELRALLAPHRPLHFEEVSDEAA